MVIEIVALPALRDNYIWALCAGRQCVVVDPGEAAPVRAFLSETGRTLSALLITHHHADHVGAASELAEAFAVPVYGPTSPLLPQISHCVTDGAQLSLPALGCSAQVIACPGHTPEHVSYLIDGALFCGDTLFAAGCGRILGGTAAQLYTSLRRFAQLDAATRVYCAHEYTLANLRFAAAAEPGNPAIGQRQAECQALRAQGLPTVPSRLADELASNPFLRTAQAEVRQSAAQHAGHPLTDDQAVFAALRAWKDVF